MILISCLVCLVSGVGVGVSSMVFIGVRRQEKVYNEAYKQGRRHGIEWCTNEVDRRNERMKSEQRKERIIHKYNNRTN